MMEPMFEIARWLHIVSGFLALIVLWLPMVTRKGRKLHRQTGWVFVISMTAIAVTAFYMGVYRIVWDAGTEPDSISFSWFLIFIAILSGATAWYGVRVLRFKRRETPHREPLDLFFSLLLLIASIGIIVYGWAIHFQLLQYFPIIGLFLGGSQLYYWLSKPKSMSHWVVEHIVGMLSCCIAVITAFIVFGAPRLLQVESVHLLLWFLPTIIFVPLIIVLTNYYGRKFAFLNKEEKRG